MFPFSGPRQHFLPVGSGTVIPLAGRALPYLHAHPPCSPAAAMDKEKREALQVAKELTCKFIETRTVSPGNIAEVFPLIYRVVAATIRQDSDSSPMEKED